MKESVVMYLCEVEYMEVSMLKIATVASNASLHSPSLHLSSCVYSQSC